MESSFPAGWRYRQKLVVSMWQTGYINLTDFPVLLVWTGTAGTSNLAQAIFDADGSTPAKSDGSDIRVTTDKYGKIPIPFEIVGFSTNNDPSLARAEIWVKLPTVFFNCDTTFYIWWGNTNATALSANDTYGRENTWSTSFKGVWHMQESGTPYADSTVNANNGTTAANVSQQDGRIAKCQYYNGGASTAYINVPHNASLSPTGAITISAWVKATNWSSNRRIIQKGATNNQWGLHASGSSMRFHLSGASDTDLDYGTLPGTGAWHHVAATYDGANKRLYYDGSEVASEATTGSIATSSDAVNIGHNPGSSAAGDSMYGYLDEVRVESVARPWDWIVATYNNMNAPNSFIKQGNVETLGVMTGWKRKCAITNDRTKLGGDEYDIIVPLVWTGSQETSPLPREMFDADGAFPAKSDGSDVRFTTDPNGCEQLAFEIVSFSTNNDPSLASAEIWVRVKFLSSSSNTTIYVWYNNASASALGDYDGQGKQSCWRDNADVRNFGAVYHMNGSGNAADATLNGLTATNNGSTSVAGKIGSARAFNGSSQYLTCSQYQYDDFSILFWMKTSASSLTGTQWYQGNGLIDSEVVGSAADYGITVLNNKIAFGMGTPDTTIQSVATVNDGNWHFAACTRVASSGAMKLYLDTAVAVSGTGATARRNGTTSRAIGRLQTGSQYFNGSIDEIWAVNTAIAAAQITSIYNSQNSPQTFWTVGTPDSLIFPNGWKFKVPLTQDHTKNINAVQNNFVSLLAWTGSAATSCLPQTMFDADGPCPAKSDGSDIRVTSDAAGVNLLPIEIVNFSTNNDPANGRAEIFVKVPQVSHLVDVVIYVWWGNASAVAARTYDCIGRDYVWSDYLMVYHGENQYDSTGNGYDLTLNNMSYSSGPLVGNGFSFNGSTSYAQTPSQPSSLNWLASGSFYITFWGYWNAFNSWSRIFDWGSGAPLDNILFSNQGTSGSTRFDCVNNTTEQINDNASLLSLSTWTYIGCRFLAGTGITTLKNGAVVTSTAGNTPLRRAVRGNCYLGRSNWGADAYLSAVVDEFRVRKIYPDYFRTSDYNTINDPHSYWGVGSLVINGLQMVVSGAWKQVTKVSMVKSGAWKDVSNIQLVKSSAWKQVEGAV
jgi:hypothetical protein